jgi:hypothetical protein
MKSTKLDWQLSAILFLLWAIWEGHNGWGTIDICIATMSYLISIFGY